ncbi:MAG: recombination protein NinB [Hyphomicrobiales bacterium]
MSGITIILRDQALRARAKAIVDKAPADAVVTIREATRNAEQNARMWAMLTDVALSKPEGRRWTTETWKCAFMQSLGHQCLFAEGLDGSGPFPIGFKSSRLKVGEMADLITVIQEYGDRHGVQWSDPKELRGAA